MSVLPDDFSGLGLYMHLRDVRDELMNRVSSLFALSAALVSLILTGCETAAPTQSTGTSTRTAASTSSNTTRTETIWKAAPDQSQKNLVTATPTSSASVVTTPAPSSDVIMRTDQLEVTKTLIQPGQVGEEVRYRIELRALREVKNVRVTESMPEHVEFISARPAASKAGQDVSWNFAKIESGSSKTIDVTVKPLKEGDYSIDSTITVDNNFGINFFAGQPKLLVEKKGPAVIELGEEATWTVTVTNQGSAPATNVIVSDILPDAFQPASDMNQNVGTVAPGQSVTATYTAKAIKQGEFTNRAAANYDGGSTSAAPEAKVPVRVVQSGIRVRKIGPADAYVFKPAQFDITIENVGDTDLQDVRITDFLPKGSSVANSGGGRVSGDAIGWMIPQLPAGSSQLIRTEIAATRKGTSTNTVKVLTKRGLEASDSLETNWKAVPGVTISITDSIDPIQVGGETVYSIQVKNQGKFEPVSGTVTVTFTDQVKPTAVSGDAQGVISGQTVTFPKTTLEAGKDIDLSITAEGANIGPGRAVLNFSAGFLNDPILSQEATNVY